MKLNYTSLQHAIEPVEEEQLALPVGRAVAVLALHGQLAALAWAFARLAPEGRLGYVQTEAARCRAGTRARCGCCASAACWRDT